MDASTYKIIHMISFMILFFAFGGITLGARTAKDRVFPYKRLYIILHGVGLALILVSGFGLLARLYGHTGSFPLWIIIKLFIWLTFGVILSLLLRKPQFNKYSWAALLGLGLTAAILAVLKPF